jgi:hypothetical protein
MQKKVVLLKVKEGKLETWKSWCNELETLRREEAMETLKEEKVIEETCLLVDFHGAPYVVAFMEGEMLPADMACEINQKHDAMKKECLEYVSEGESLYNLRLQ